MPAIKVEPGRGRGPDDGSRRFTPGNFAFDTRALTLAAAIDDNWDESIKEQERRNQASIRESILHEYGVEDYAQKIQNFVDLGRAPWSVVALHNVYLAQSRAAFVGLNYYPALLGASGLGERLLNQLVLSLRQDYEQHEATKRVAAKQSFDNWDVCIKALRGWGTISDEVANEFRKLMVRRNSAVHYRSELDSGDAREAALDALLLIGGIVEALFSPIGKQPHYFTGPIGRSYVRLGWEDDPFVRKFILPACVLVSPVFRFVATAHGFDVYDDSDYGVGHEPLTDDEFGDPARAEIQVAHPF